jgi:hypothetical protein
MGESAEATACDFGIAERVRENSNQQLTIRMMPEGEAFVIGITQLSNIVAGKWHGRSEGKAVQQSMPLRLAHPMPQELSEFL